jgi:glyoxylase-like metal-dependent hydrolase (beta-lactamase superfamily II)
LIVYFIIQKFWGVMMSVESVSDHVSIIDAPFLSRGGVLGTYLIRGENFILVDPGPTVSIPYIEESLQNLGITSEALRFLVPTHIHLDHAAGSWRLMQAYPDTMLLVHPRGSAHMVDPSRLEAGARGLFGDAVSNYGEVRGLPVHKVAESKDGEEIDLNGVTVRVIWTPGHSAHHQCLYVSEDRVLILGDAGGHYDPVFDNVMPTTPPPFNPVKAVESIERLVSLEPEILCYGHFGFTENAVQRLEAHKNQIQLWSRIVEDGLKDQLVLEDIYEIIMVEDPQASSASLLGDNVERSPSVSLMGFVRYHEWRAREKDGYLN